MDKSLVTEVVIGADGKEYHRTICEVFTRVMGYYRPVSQFNKGKKSEFYSRLAFKEKTLLIKHT